MLINDYWLELLQDVEVRMRMGKMVLQTVGVELIERRIPKDDDCYDFSAWAYWPDRMHRRTVEMLEEVSSKSKSWLKEQCQSNTLFQEHIIGCLAASKYNAWRFPKVLNDICCYPRMPFFLEMYSKYKKPCWYGNKRA